MRSPVKPVRGGSIGGGGDVAECDGDGEELERQQEALSSPPDSSDPDGISGSGSPGFELGTSPSAASDMDSASTKKKKKKKSKK